MASASGRWLEQVRLESTDAMVAWDTSCITCWRSRTGFFWEGHYVMNYKCQATASVGSCPWQASIVGRVLFFECGGCKRWGSAEQEGAGDECGRKTHEWDQACGGIGFFFCQLRCGLRCSQEVCGAASCGVDATNTGRTAKQVGERLEGFVAESQQNWEAFVGGHCLVLDTTRWTRKRRMALQGWYCFQHSGAASTLAMGFVVAVFICAWLLQCRLEWDMCFVFFMWVCALCTMRRNACLMHSWNVIIWRWWCWSNFCQQLCRTASHGSEATSAARSWQDVAVWVAGVVAES